MTYDTHVTPAGARTATTPHIAKKSDSEGYWVEWIKNAETGSLDPYREAEMAESVFIAKKVELSHDA